MTKLHELGAAGQSVWLDFIRRSLLTSGELQALIDQGVTGMTSNPSIFDKAISGSADYDVEMEYLAAEDKSAEEIYEALALEDIARAAEMMRPVYERTQGRDGYISLEVNPLLAHDSVGTIAEGRRLFSLLARPNILIKIPATYAGVPAIKALISEGVNVNVTLLFSLKQYEAIADAYLSGLETRVAAGQEIDQISSAASFFVSRVDRAVDRELEHVGNAALRGTIAIANAKIAYRRFQQILASDRWQRLAERGARAQRQLWASTSTKNPAYPDTLYVDELIGAQTINTMPPKTMQAFLDHGTVAQTLASGVDEARAQLDELAALGIDLGEITSKLQGDGIVAFIDAYRSLLGSIAEKLGIVS